MNQNEIILTNLFKVPHRRLFICNHSGGKDSQAMFKWLYDHVPHQDLIIVHAHLPEVSWEGTIDHIKKHANGIPLFVVQADKTFFDLVDARGKFPSPKYRNCTSDLKRAPISKLIRSYSKKKGYTEVYNCIGIRSEESSKRKGKVMIEPDKKLTTESRQVFTFLPIKDYTLSDVFMSHDISLNDLYRLRKIYASGLHQEAINEFPFFYTYLAGMTRHSCKICIMSSISDICTSAEIDPINAIRYIEKEREINYSMSMPIKGKTKFLDQIIAEEKRKSLHQNRQRSLAI